MTDSQRSSTGATSGTAERTDDDVSAEPPMMQRLYDRVWLVATIAFVFFLLTYVVWGVVDIMAVPAG